MAPRRACVGATNPVSPGRMGTAMPSAPLASSHNSAQRRNATCHLLTSDSGRLAHLPPPLGGSLLQVLPCDGATPLSLELIVERLRVMVVEKLERGAGRQFVEGPEDERVPLTGRDGAHVQLLHACHSF